MSTYPNISKHLFLVLKICWVFHILLFIQLLLLQVVVFVSSYNSYGQLLPIFNIVSPVFGFPALFLWGYCIYFFFRYDKYSIAGINLFFCGGVFSPIYFYRIIWKRKRALENKINQEPILNKTILLESEEND
jgi:hypothetical protein